MIKFCVRLVQRWLPEPFIFAILLTFVAALVAMPLCHQTPFEVVEHWGGGVWNLLAFAMQMALVLVCGSTLAAAPVVKRAIDAMYSNNYIFSTILVCKRNSNTTRKVQS